MMNQERTDSQTSADNKTEGKKKRKADKTIWGCEKIRVGGEERDKCGGAVNSATRPTAKENSHSVC